MGFTRGVGVGFIRGAGMDFTLGVQQLLVELSPLWRG